MKKIIIKGSILVYFLIYVGILINAMIWLVKEISNINCICDNIGLILIIASIIIFEMITASYSFEKYEEYNKEYNENKTYKNKWFMIHFSNISIVYVIVMFFKYIVNPFLDKNFSIN